MAIFQALIAALGRQVGRLVNTVFGWATTTLFGKVPQEKQTLLSIMALGSVLWIVVVIGVIFPEAGVFLLSFVNLPEWVQDWWVRLAMLAVALILPAIIGFLATKVTDAEDQPKNGEEMRKRILHGYPYTVATAVALIMMVFFVPILRLKTLAKRWSTEHLPMIVEEQDYMTMVSEIERALDNANYPVTRTQSSILLRLPIMVLTKIAGSGQTNMVADNLTTLRSKKLELILYPSDLAISGSKYDAAHARAVVAEQLAFSPAHLTWTKEANELEDRLEALWNEAKAVSAAEPKTHLIRKLKAIEKDLRRSKIPHEEWEVLFREKLLVERGILQLAAGLTNRLKEPAEANADDLGAEQLPSTPFGMAKKLIPQGFALLGVALMTKLFKGKSDAHLTTLKQRAATAADNGDYGVYRAGAPYTIAPYAEVSEGNEVERDRGRERVITVDPARTLD